ncbi:MAG: DHA2 family efflux MFS transporter permease subunit [Corynebacterium sp.]|nr:DHA2 family efflux MFS transporter permease subunit [Corynebacterium sp.]
MTNSQRPANASDQKQSLAHAWRAMGALCLGFFMILLDATIVSVATPDLVQDLNTSLNAVVWVTSIYLLTYAVPLLVTGRMGDRFGQRNMYQLGMIVFTLSSLACALAPNVSVLILARAVQGLGASLLTPQTMSVINRLFPPQARGAAMGLWGSVAGLASLTGPILGGFLVTSVGWRWIFLINVPIGVISLILVTMWVPKFESVSRKIDMVSVLLSVVSVFLLVFGLQQGESHAWAWWIWVMMAAGVLGIILFVRVQRGKEEALMPLDLFQNRNFTLGSLSMITMGFAIAATPLALMLYLQTAMHLDAMHAAYLTIPQALFSGLLSPFVGRMADRLHPRILSCIGFGGMVISNVLLIVTMVSGVDYLWVLIPNALLGISSAFVWSPNSATAMRTVPLNRLGAASGVYNTFRQFGSVIGAAVISVAMQVTLNHFAFAQAMGYSLIVVAIVLAFGLFAVSGFRQVSREEVHA